MNRDYFDTEAFPDARRVPADEGERPQAAAERALRRQAAMFAKQFAGEMQRARVKEASIVQFKQQMQAVSAAKADQITNWQNYHWMDQWGDDTMSRSIDLARNGTWSVAPRYGYA